jgi:thiamine-monophosphate kinase
MARAALLAGGDDYELCFTAHPSRKRAIERAAKRAGVGVAPIGRITRGRRKDRVTVLDAGGRRIRLEHAGFEHF